MGTPVRSAAMLLSTPTKGSPWTGARGALTPTRRAILGSPSLGTPSKKDSLIKVTFKQTHDAAPHKSCMYIIGSLPSLGSWDAKKARRMHADEDGGGWTLSFYIPEKVEFLYQYFLADESSSDGGDPKILWEGGLERKCHIAEAIGTPNKSMLVSDDTRGEAPPGSLDSKISGGVRISHAGAVVEKIASSNVSQALEIEGLQQHVGSLESERSQVQMELEKLRDLLAVKVPDTVQGDTKYGDRDSYVPDSGPLYDMVKKMQAIVRASDFASCSSSPSSPAESVEQLRAELEAAHAAAVSEVEERMAEAQSKIEGEADEAKARHAAEILELKEYYSKTLGELDDSAKKTAEERAAAEAQRTMLQTNVRVAAGEVQSIRRIFNDLQQDAQTLKASLVPDLGVVSERIAEGVGAASAGMEASVVQAVEKLRSETKERKRLHNLVQELKGNIRVFCRVRPGKEGEGSGAVSVSTEEDMLVEANGKASSFQYDRVFAPSSSQEEVFEETEPLIVSVLDGYNVCIFAYGQTGSGKTHTMQGYGSNPGVNVRALSSLFDLARQRSDVTTYSISVSLMEIYNETIKDLVEPKDDSGELKKLDVKNAPEGGTHVPGICLKSVDSMDHVEAVLAVGQKNRSTGSTNMNEQSSRSHMILSVHVKATQVTNGAVAYGKLHLIDLAGSERVGKSGAQGDRLKEAQNINKSLSALGDCVQSLVAKSKHVPFRNSKLTYLLQDSLGGDSKALMFVCVSPGEPDASETLCSLNFASRVRNVELGPAKRKGDGGAEAKLRERERELEGAREEARRDKAEAEKLRSKLSEMKREAEALQASADAARRDAEKAKNDADAAKRDAAAATAATAAAAGSDSKRCALEAPKSSISRPSSSSSASSRLKPPGAKSCTDDKAAAVPAPAAPAAAAPAVNLTLPTVDEGEIAATEAATATNGSGTSAVSSARIAAPDDKENDTAANSDAPSTTRPEHSAGNSGAATSKGPTSPAKSDNSMAGLTLDEKLARHRAQKKALAAASHRGGEAEQREGRVAGILKNSSHSDRPQSAPPSRLGVSRIGIGGPARVINKAERKPLDRSNNAAPSFSTSTRIPRR